MSPLGKLLGAALAALLAASGCAAARSGAPRQAASESAASLAAWSTVYAVLQHPRCANCHPPDRLPRQGDLGAPHAQNVQGGPDGRGLFAMRCDACHAGANLPGAHLPPGAPNWHLPPEETPMVFLGRSSGELCRQLKDPARNGGKQPEELFEHMAHDALVLWGWSPGEGRNPVPIPHAELVGAVRTWVDGGCACPE